MRLSQMQIDLLHRGDFSLVMMKDEYVRTFTQRGVADLYGLLTEDPAYMQGSLVADKVVGKGAASLMVLGGVREVYADVISEPALETLRKGGVLVTYKQLVPFIENRDKTGWCPVETLCRDAKTPQEALPLIADFLEKISSRSPKM
ncbi:MAG: DUF1893 domain-containing protein [Paludibacteraceae bacterium]|nr:DUF1893 domain-containing protein [Paludibacteraceae bacterium]